jgi:glutamate dehydrogenase/leucine dehydrogenase
MHHELTDYAGLDPHASAKLAEIHSPLLSTRELFELYNFIRSSSDLSPEAVLYEIERVLTGAMLGRYFYQSLSIREIAFLITNNRYQEAIGQDEESLVDVKGRFDNKRLYLVSEHEGLPRKIMTTIQELMKENRGKTYRLSSYVISFDARASRDRRIYILEEETPGPKDPDITTQAKTYIEKKLGTDVTSETIDEFLESATERFIDGLMHNQRIRTLENYLLSWCKLKTSLDENRDILVKIDSNIIRDEPVPEKRIQLWLPAENFMNNYVAINSIFVKRGIPFTRQYFETFRVDGRLYIVFSTYVSDELINPEIESFIENALYSRSVLYTSHPVPVGEIKGILDRVKGAGKEEKLDLITTMRQNKQKEYLIPLVYLLNDEDIVVSRKSFDLIRHYLYTPSPDMKSDYYWATLFNIFAASTVPVVADDQGYSRPLNNMEIVKLIRFRDIYYETFTEPESGNEYLFIRMNGIGIGKGGIRADAHHVSFSGEGALSTNMLFKCLGLGIPLFTTGKGGILGDLGQGETRTRVLAAYADFLYYTSGIGPLSDVPAGDVGIGPDEIQVIYERITDNVFSDLSKISQNGPARESAQQMILTRHFGINCSDSVLVSRLAGNRDAVENYTASAITGKPGTKGLALRTGATARGLKEVLAVIKAYRSFDDASLWSDQGRINEAMETDRSFYQTANSHMKMLTVSIQGFGKVGANFANMMDEIGARVISISDRSGTLVNKTGIRNMGKLSALCSRGNFLLENAPEDLMAGSTFIKGDTLKPLTAVVDVAVPAALEEVITLTEKEGGSAIHAHSVNSDYVLQGANGPITPEAEEALMATGKISIPDILANSGGVLGSYLEWLNGLINQFGYQTIHDWGFVHPIVHNLVDVYHPKAVPSKLHDINAELYDYAFKFILRSSAMKTIRMAYENKISLRTAYMALGIALAADEGRLTESFEGRINTMRERFSLKTI